MIRVTILGNNSALPAFDRHPTAQTIEISDQTFLMDCGEGTQKQMHRYNVKPSRINHIFISHLHGDHYFGLIGLLSSMALWHYQKTIHLYGPPRLIDIVNIQFDCVGVKLPYKLVFHPVVEGEHKMLVDEKHYSVECFPVHHSVPTHGFIFREKSSGRKINPEACRAEGIPKTFYNHLKQGEDYIKKDGRIVPNQQLTEDGTPDKVYAFCADTLYEDSYLPFIKKADMIYHESTFLKGDLEKALLRFHSTAEQAALAAQKAEIGQLLIGHYSSRYAVTEPFEAEARNVFPNTVATQEGDSFEVK